MPVNVLLEPLVVVSLLLGGTIINRNHSTVSRSHERRSYRPKEVHFNDDPEDGNLLTDHAQSPRSRSWSPSHPYGDGKWTTRQVGLFRWKRRVATPDTSRYSSRALSRLLHYFPFLVEAWYWALIYWVRPLPGGQGMTDNLRFTNLAEPSQPSASIKAPST